MALDLEEQIDMAMTYIEDYGFSVFPINPENKKPCIEWKEYQSRKPTPEEVELWFLQFPNAYLAVATGHESGVYVVDADSEELITTAKEMGFGSTVQVKTRRGAHFYHKCPMDGVWRGPQSGSGSKGEVWPQIKGLDFRGDGGYAVLPPTPGYSWVMQDWDMMPTYKDYVGKKLPVSEGTDNFEDLDLSGLGTKQKTQWELTREDAERYVDDKIPRGGSGIYDRTFNYLGEAVLEFGLGKELEEAGRRYMSTWFEYPLEEPRFQQNLKSIRELERKNHPERFNEQGEYVGHVSSQKDDFTLEDDEPSKEEKKIERIPFTVSDAEAMLEKVGQQTFWLTPFIRKPSIIQVHGYSGHGKSMFLQHALYHLSKGMNFGPFECSAPAKILYFDFENGMSTLANQFDLFSRSFGNAGDGYKVWTPYIEGGAAINLKTAEGELEFKRWVLEHKPDIVVFDTLRSAYPGLEENNAQEWARINQLALALRNFGATVILVHHSNKPGEDGFSREAGSSNQLTVLETQMKITQVYESKETAKHNGGIFNGDTEDQPWHSLRRKAPRGGNLQVVMEARYGKVREWTDMHERVQYIGFGLTHDEKRFVVGSMSPQERARSLFNDRSVTRTLDQVADMLKRSVRSIREWVA